MVHALLLLIMACLSSPLLLSSDQQGDAGIQVDVIPTSTMVQALQERGETPTDRLKYRVTSYYGSGRLPDTPPESSLVWQDQWTCVVDGTQRFRFEREVLAASGLSAQLVGKQNLYTWDGFTFEQATVGGLGEPWQGLIDIRRSYDLLDEVMMDWLYLRVCEFVADRTLVDLLTNPRDERSGPTTTSAGETVWLVSPHNVPDSEFKIVAVGADHPRVIRVEKRFYKRFMPRTAEHLSFTRIHRYHFEGKHRVANQATITTEYPPDADEASRWARVDIELQSAESVALDDEFLGIEFPAGTQLVDLRFDVSFEVGGDRLLYDGVFFIIEQPAKADLGEHLVQVLATAKRVESSRDEEQAPNSMRYLRIGIPVVILIILLLFPGKGGLWPRRATRSSACAA